MSLIKLAASKWKYMIANLSDNSIAKLKGIIPTKNRYIAGMEKGIVNRTKALEKKHGITIHNQASNSKTMDLFGMKVKLPVPVATVPLDSKNYLIVSPKNHRRNVVNLGNLNSSNDEKILHLYTKQHELSEISEMAKHVSKLEPKLIPQNIVNKASKRLNSLKESEGLQLNPHSLGPNYHSHFNKKVLNFDNSFTKKMPYRKVADKIKTFRGPNELS